MQTEKSKTAEELAFKFHQIYERLAPKFGYETKSETKIFDKDSANGKLMIAVCDEILTTGQSAESEKEKISFEELKAMFELQGIGYSDAFLRRIYFESKSK